MALNDRDLKKYQDKHLTVNVPAYLRQQRRMLIFTKNLKNLRHGQNLIFVSVIILRDEEQAETQRQAMDVVSSYTWTDVEFSILRRGQVNDLKDSYEMLGKRRCLRTETIQYDWTVVFRKQNKMLHVRIGGVGELGNFEHLCNSIVDSINLLSSTEASLKSPPGQDG